MSPTINSRLRPHPERADPANLQSNRGLGFRGTTVYGQGFLLTPEERDDLVKRNKKNAECIFPYIGGEEVNTSPIQDFHRYVINFGESSMAEAESWPDLMDIVRQYVKPERDRLHERNAWNRDVKSRWWQFAALRVGLYAAIADLPRCLVNSNVSKHLLFAFQPTDRVFGYTLCVYQLSAYTHFAVLQSRVHEPWVRLLSSTLGEAPRYSASDCFDNFPFPDPDPRTILPPVEAAGCKLYEARAAYMVETDQGLTKTYNALKDPECSDAPIIELRRLHEAVDRAVLDAYGWADINVPPYVVTDHEYEATVIERLYGLNDVRHREEHP